VAERTNATADRPLKSRTGGRFVKIEIPVSDAEHPHHASEKPPEVMPDRGEHRQPGSNGKFFGAAELRVAWDGLWLGGFMQQRLPGGRSAGELCRLAMSLLINPQSELF